MTQFQTLHILMDTETRSVYMSRQPSYTTNAPLAKDLGVAISRTLSKKIAEFFSARFPLPSLQTREEFSPEPLSERHDRSRLAQEEFPFDIEQFFEAHFAAMQDELERNLESLLLGAMLAGAAGAINFWLARFGYAGCSEAKPNTGLLAAAKEAARRALARLRARLWEWIQKLATKLWKAGATPEEIARRILQALGDSREIENEIEALMDDETFDAVTEGEYQAHVTMAAKRKRWDTVGDLKVCLLCRINELKGWIPLEERFPSGHYKEKAHPLCRCHVVKEGVTAEGVAKALQAYGIVCQIEPGSS